MTTYVCCEGNGKKHPIDYATLVGSDKPEKRQLTLEQTVPKVVTEDMFRDELAKLVLMARLPLSFVDDMHFRNFLGLVGVRFTVPCRTTLTPKIISHVANSLREAGFSISGPRTQTSLPLLRRAFH